MTVGVIVIAAGREVHLQRTLSGLDRQLQRPDSIVVVNMGVDTIQLPPGSDVRTLDCTAGGGPLPLGAARNAGAAATSAEHLVFLDVDCIPDPHLVARYDSVLADHPAALVCGPVRYLREGWTSSAGAVCGDLDDLVAMSDAPQARPVPHSHEVVVDARHELFWSLAFGVRRSTWDMIGGFDERYVGYGAEDTDLGFRSREAGLDIAWFGGAGTAFHQWHEPSRLDPARAPEIVANAITFHSRWGRWPMRGWLVELSRLGLVDFDAESDSLRARS